MDETLTDVRLLGAVDHLQTLLSNENVKHGILLTLGMAGVLWLAAIVFCNSRRLPWMIAAIGSLSLGLWVNLLVYDWQQYGAPFGDGLPSNWWVPVVAGVIAALLALVLVATMWKVALTLLSATIASFLVLALLRLANLPIDAVEIHVEMLSGYRAVAVASFLVAVIICALLVRKHDVELLVISSVHLGVFFSLSGLSHFAQKFFKQDPLSLFDNIANILREVYQDRCVEQGLQDDMCKCGTKCKAEVVLWIALSWLIIVYVLCYHRSRARVAREDGADKSSGGARQGAEPRSVNV